MFDRFVDWCLGLPDPIGFTVLISGVVATSLLLYVFVIGLMAIPGGLIVAGIILAGWVLWCWICALSGPS